ncbi:hypothetical protein C8Q73DRAFT_116072 [Cubamyces lactineus]|nr:hypothetical protein C8Q73DRAFT_116072 [Cubamyces lactineus]
MPHMRSRMSLELPPHEPIDILYDADYKHALEGTSPKPCIVPGNALHLIDDDPAAPRSQTPPSIIIVADEDERERERRGSSTTDMDGDGDRDGDVEGDPETSEGDRRPTRPTGPRVRFRSRVRITSGVHRHRHSTSTANGTPTPCSSASDSPSSSISAPLRYQSDENGAWGPLGKRLSAYAAGGGWSRRTHTPQIQVQTQQRVQIEQPVPPRAVVGGRIRGGKARRGYDERTPLIRPDRRRMYVESEEEEDVHGRDDRLSPEERALRAAALRREEEAVFGRWPWRIFNRHVSALASFSASLGCDVDVDVARVCCSGGGGTSSLCCAAVARTTRTTRSSDNDSARSRRPDALYQRLAYSHILGSFHARPPNSWLSNSPLHHLRRYPFGDGAAFRLAVAL